MAHSVFVLLLTWNHLPDTLECLDSLARQTYPNLRIVLVDNGSTDATVSTVRAKFPETHLIENGQNLGYAEGNNVGLRYALEQNADYIFVLNNDTTLASDCIAKLVAALQTNPNAAATPKCFFADAPDMIYYAGGALTAWQTTHRGYNQRDSAEYAVSGETEWLTGCAIIAPRAVWVQVGLFEPRYFLLFEDTDWSLRARRLGVTLRYVADAKLWHKASRSFGEQFTPTYAYYYMRNTLLFIERNFSLRQKRWMYHTALCHAHTQPLLSAAQRSPERMAALHRAITQGIRDYFFRRFGQQPLH
ncbi:MAG: glycosyl transferase [Chloroflexota bacterium]|nr:MAG: glycosyl transferase [Chloroflexota bacterium]